jgi:stage IV sporulation protein FB
MGWESRDYGRDDDGKFRSAVRRIFDGENPLVWSLPLYSAWGIRVRISLIYVVWILGQLIFSMVKNNIGFPYMAIGMGALLLLVLLHEYGHCIACRAVGGSADRILLWPLGGLASCSPPGGWCADLITTIGGPAVNALLWPILAGALFLMLPASGRSEAFLFNPFNPGPVIGGLHAGYGDTARYWTIVTLWMLYYSNAALFLFNVLVPMFPMDSARIVQALIWRKMGYRTATAFVAKLGFVVAAIMLVVGLSEPLLFALAVFGAGSCWLELQRLKMTGEGEHPALAGYDFERGYKGLPGAEDDRARVKATAAVRQREENDQAELDRILAKIARDGMGSLSASEKRWLQRATERRRRA